jgi:hypothetical protein
MLKHAEPVIVLQKLALTKPIPQNTADTMKFRRPVPFAANDTCRCPKASRRRRRRWPMSTCRCSLRSTATSSRSPTRSRTVRGSGAQQRFGDAARRAGRRDAEQMTYNVVKAGTTVAYANGSARNAGQHRDHLNKIRAVIRTLKANKAKMLTRILDASPAYGTSSVEAGYVAVCHTDCEADIRGLRASRRLPTTVRARRSATTSSARSRTSAS